MPIRTAMPEGPDPSGSLKALAVVPVFNHGATLRAVVEGLLAVGLPVLVVDDGSTEDVLSRVEDLPIRRLRLEPNRGKGAALLAGARRAAEEGFEALLAIDADGQHHPADAPGLLAVAQANWPALVLGTRDLEGPNVPGSSRFGRAFSNFWIRLECGRRLADTQSGFRVYPVSHLVSDRFLTRRYTFEVEVLVKVAWQGLPILEHPIAVTYPPGRARISHFRVFRDNLRLTGLHTYLVGRSLLPWGRRTARPDLPALKSLSREVLLHPLAFLRRLAREHATPAELATAVWLGVFLGSLPLIPFGLAVILYVSHRLHLNKLAAAGASNLCVAPFVPFLCIQVGHLLRHGTLWTTFNRQGLLNEAGHRLLEWLLGALVVGPLLGLAAALPVYVLLKRLQGSANGKAPGAGA